jgi:ribosome-associated protein
MRPIFHRMDASHDDSMLRISRDLILPRAELTFRASRSGGPGGQHVNKTSSRIELTWDVRGSAALDEAQRSRLAQRLATRLDTTGVLRLVADGERSQLRNREEVVERFIALVADALRVPKTRRKTKPTKASKERRLTAKRIRGERKRERRRPGDD